MLQAQPDTADVEEGLAGSPSEDAMTGALSHSSIHLLCFPANVRGTH